MPQAIYTTHEGWKWLFTYALHADRLQPASSKVWWNCITRQWWTMKNGLLLQSLFIRSGIQKDLTASIISATLVLSPVVWMKLGLLFQLNETDDLPIEDRAKTDDICFWVAYTIHQSWNTFTGLIFLRRTSAMVRIAYKNCCTILIHIRQKRYERPASLSSPPNARSFSLSLTRVASLEVLHCMVCTVIEINTANGYKQCVVGCQLHVWGNFLFSIRSTRSLE